MKLMLPDAEKVDAMQHESTTTTKKAICLSQIYFIFFFSSASKEEKSYYCYLMLALIILHLIIQYWSSLFILQLLVFSRFIKCFSCIHQKHRQNWAEKKKKAKEANYKKSFSCLNFFNRSSNHYNII